MIPGGGRGIGHQDAVFAEDGAGTGHRVAAGLGVVAENGSKFSAAGVNTLVVDANDDIARQEPEVGEFGNAGHAKRPCMTSGQGQASARDGESLGF